MPLFPCEKYVPSEKPVCKLLACRKFGRSNNLMANTTRCSCISERLKNKTCFKPDAVRNGSSSLRGHQQIKVHTVRSPRDHRKQCHRKMAPELTRNIASFLLSIFTKALNSSQHLVEHLRTTDK